MAGVVFWKVISTLKTKKKPETFFFGEKNTMPNVDFLFAFSIGVSKSLSFHEAFKYFRKKQNGFV